MAPEAITQDRVYAGIRADYLAGVFRPGARIDLSAIADRHRASTTPVREAVHRLIGERLLSPHPEGGFRLALPDPVDLADLYAWYGQQILAAVHVVRPRTLTGYMMTPTDAHQSRSPRHLANYTAHLFQRFANATRNSEIIEQVSAANDRLFYARIAEYHVFPNLARELQVLTRSDGQLAIATLRRRIAAFHERRIMHATDIVALLTDAEFDMLGPS